MLKIKATKQFKKDLKKLAHDSTKDLKELEKVINILASEQTLPANYRDHALIGKLKSYRECHIAPDWLLMYRIENKELILTLARTGSHAGILNM